MHEKTVQICGRRNGVKIEARGKKVHKNIITDNIQSNSSISST